MGTRIIEQSCCDWCEVSGDSDVPAQSQRITDPDTGTEYDTDMCGLCKLVWYLRTNTDVQRRLDNVDRLLNVARVVRRSDQGAPARVRNAIVDHVEAPEPGQLAIMPDSGMGQTAEPEPAVAEPITHVICQDCEPPRRIRYPGRVDHARVHRTEAYKIVWTLESGEPLPFPCRVHDECDQTGYAFGTPQARGMHENQKLREAGDPVIVAGQPRRKDEKPKSKTWKRSGPNGAWALIEVENWVNNHDLAPETLDNFVQ